MSVQAIGWVLENSMATLGTRLVLIAIANHAKADGSGAWPSLRVIASEAGISERAARYALRVAESSGELITEIAAGPKGANLYDLPLVRGGTGANIAPLLVVPPAKSVVEGGKISLKGGHASAPEPSITVKEPPLHADKVAALVDIWKTFGPVPALRLSAKRRAAAVARLKEEPDMKIWGEAAKRVAKSAFCRGENDRGWKADLDWFLRPDTLAKIEEGKYDDRLDEAHRKRVSPPKEAFDSWLARRAATGGPGPAGSEVSPPEPTGPSADGVD